MVPEENLEGQNDSLAIDYGFVILEKRFVDVTRRYGIMENYIKGGAVTSISRLFLVFPELYPAAHSFFQLQFEEKH